jgi:hypothetical protein
MYTLFNHLQLIQYFLQKFKLYITVIITMNFDHFYKHSLFITDKEIHYYFSKQFNIKYIILYLLNLL